MILVVAAIVSVLLHNTYALSASSSSQRSIPTVTLENGVIMPQYALGTAFFKEGVLRPELAYRSVTLALEAGIRHIETALVYRSHRPIGSVLGNFWREGSLAREDVFLTSKVYHGVVPFESFRGDDTTLDLDALSPEKITMEINQQVGRTLDELGVGYVDLLLLHWPSQWGGNKPESTPQNRKKRLAAWKVLEKSLVKGWTRAIGVANFSEVHLEQLMEDGAKIRPMLNQLETSVYVHYSDIIKYCNDNGITVMAYAPIGSPDSVTKTNAILENPYLQTLGEKYGKNVGQIALRYILQKNYALTTLSTSGSRIRSNLESFDFVLDDADMEKLETLKGKQSMLGLPSPYELN